MKLLVLREQGASPPVTMFFFRLYYVILVVKAFLAYRPTPLAFFYAADKRKEFSFFLRLEKARKMKRHLPKRSERVFKELLADSAVYFQGGESGLANLTICCELYKVAGPNKTRDMWRLAAVKQLQESAVAHLPYSPSVTSLATFLSEQELHREMYFYKNDPRGIFKCLYDFVCSNPVRGLDINGKIVLAELVFWTALRDESWLVPRLLG